MEQASIMHNIIVIKIIKESLKVCGGRKFRSLEKAWTLTTAIHIVLCAQQRLYAVDQTNGQR